MQAIELKSYAFTLQIPAFKKVRHYEKYMPYKDYTSQEQETILYETMRFSCSDVSEKISFDIKFEKHKDGRMHCHGVLHSISSSQLFEIKKNVGICIGVKTEKQINDCCFCIPLFLSHGWNTYMNKEQPKEEEIDYSEYRFGKTNVIKIK